MECKVHGVAKSRTQLSDLHLHFLFLTNFFWLQGTACRVLVPQPGIEPMPPAVKVWCSNHPIASEFRNCLFFMDRLYSSSADELVLFFSN